MNASHAMRRKGGRLDVDLSSVKISEGDAQAYQDIKPGEYLKLTVSDTGHGMGKDTVSRIFEPYFTTKTMEEGTGLGLSTVHGIVKNHGGDIRVFSNPGEGTTFQILFPVIETKVERAVENSNSLPKGTEHYLTDIHGEYETFSHVLANASGVVKRKIDDIILRGRYR